MGIITRTIESPPSLSPLPDSPTSGKASLAETAQMDMVGLLKQLGALFERTNEVFTGLMEEAGSTASRIKSLGERVNRVATVVPQVARQIRAYEPCELLSKAQPARKPLKMKETAQLFSNSNRSEAVRDVIEDVRAPPCLSVMDEFTDDGSSCLKKYTNPEFFFETWLMEQEEKIAAAREKKEAKQAAKSLNAPAQKVVVKKVERRRDKISAMGAEFAEGAAVPTSSGGISTEGIGSAPAKKPKNTEKKKEKKPKNAEKKKEKKEGEKEEKKKKEKKEKVKKEPDEKKEKKESRKRGLTSRIIGGKSDEKSDRRTTDLPPPSFESDPADLPPPSLPSRGPAPSKPAGASAPPPPPMPTAPVAPPPMPVAKKNTAPVADDGEPKKPAVQTTSLLSAITSGVQLKKAEVREETMPADPANATIAQILARRAAMESDSEEEDDGWD